ncbi:hypothetical protein B9Z19DRAFT_1063805 [Tuber borchii]|uniref:Uncharacterized protein n=1 Tax=Tuber borchii TaxID=42251 RepID=A0A2T6ZX33_TUBBO|nr:hypothetical protein B9Z19DRAFT_1063805 [Tuber borchii]
MTRSALHCHPSEKSVTALPKARYGRQVDFGGVEFRYAASPDMPALDGVSCTIGLDQFVAFVKYSGTGNLSAVALLEHFYDVSTGGILVKEVNITSIPVCDYRS